MTRTNEIGLSLILIACAATGCRTAAGNYFSNRGRDFGECFRAQAGLGPGIGATIQAAGLLDVGVGASAIPRDLGIGWVYGEGYAFGQGGGAGKYDAEADTTGVAWLLSILSTPYAPLQHWSSDGISDNSLDWSYSQHSCYSILPAVLSWVGPEEVGKGTEQEESLPIAKHPPLWSGEALRMNPWAHVHAFDIEVGVFVGYVYARVGFSLGDFADFLLGWFGADIAGDDRPFEPASSAGAP